MNPSLSSPRTIAAPIPSPSQGLSSSSAPSLTTAPENKLFQSQHLQTSGSSVHSTSTPNITDGDNHTLSLFANLNILSLMAGDPQLTSLYAAHLKLCLQQQKYNAHPQWDSAVNDMLKKLFTCIIPIKYQFPTSRFNYSRSTIYYKIRDYLTLLETNTYGHVIYKDNQTEYTLIYCLPEANRKSSADLCQKLNAVYFTPQSAQHLMQCLDSGKYINSLELDKPTNKQLQNLFNQILSIKLDSSNFNHILNVSSTFYVVIKEYLEIAKNDNKIKNLYYRDDSGIEHTLS
ncbi:MAG: hypothetical protein KBD37_01165, partial [Burkholderiales bacterium]|nr:hypothetical protein [Burkholderiales bacterium]